MAELEEALRSWRAAEEKLYPVVMVRPEVYQRYVELVRAVADELWSCVTPESLAHAYGRAPEIVAVVIARFGASVDDMDVGLLAGAAFNLRYREVVAETSRKEAVRRIEEAKAKGEPWVVLYEMGKAGAALPYRRLEMHVSDGAGLHVFVEEDPETGAPVFGLERLQLDPSTGEWLSATQPSPERQTFPSADRWEEAVKALRDLYGT